MSELNKSPFIVVVRVLQTAVSVHSLCSGPFIDFVTLFRSEHLPLKKSTASAYIRTVRDEDNLSFRPWHSQKYCFADFLLQFLQLAFLLVCPFLWAVVFDEVGQYSRGLSEIPDVAPVEVATSNKLPYLLDSVGFPSDSIDRKIHQWVEFVLTRSSVTVSQSESKVIQLSFEVFAFLQFDTEILLHSHVEKLRQQQQMVLDRVCA